MEKDQAMLSLELAEARQMIVTVQQESQQKLATCCIELGRVMAELEALRDENRGLRDDRQNLQVQFKELQLEKLKLNHRYRLAWIL